MSRLAFFALVAVAVSSCGGESEPPAPSTGSSSSGGSSAGGHAGSTSGEGGTSSGSAGAGGASSDATGGSSGASNGGAGGSAGASGGGASGSTGGGAGGSSGGPSDAGAVDAKLDRAIEASEAEASISGPPGWGIHCGAFICDPSSQFCCLGSAPSCLPRGSQACQNQITLECDDRYDCCVGGVCGGQTCCANKNETGPVKAQCGVCTGEQLQFLCDPNGIHDQCGGVGPTHVPWCAPTEDAGAPRLIPGYPYCVPT